MATPPLEARASRRWRLPGTVEWLGLGAIVVVAVAVRFVGLAGRGMWDSDQGHDMLVLLALVRDGTIPLLGPPTSTGGIHHGALYYYLLAPAAMLSGADPVAVVVLIAAAGVAAVVVVWWLARSIGGPVAGLIAGGLMAIAASAIEGSTFIWNPNLLALSSAIAFGAAWRAYATGNVRWWLLAALGQAVTMQSHVLGAVLIVPLAGLLIADARRRPAERTHVLRAGIAGLGIIVASYLPLFVHELGSDFSESRAVIGFLTGSAASEGGAGAAGGPNLVLRLVVIALRSLSWPLTGLLTSALMQGLLAAAGLVLSAAWLARRGTGSERTAARWYGATLVWSVVVLAIAAPSLATVVPGLPNDHYHAFLDPIVFVMAGLGIAAMWRWGWSGRVLATVAGVTLVAFNVATWPPLNAGDGGWPAAEKAGNRILANVGTDRVLLIGLPNFKPTDAYGFPLTRLGLTTEQPDELPGSPDGSADRMSLVIACDRLFQSVIGEPCGGAAEDDAAARLNPGWQLTDRFDASSRTSISVYQPR